MSNKYQTVALSRSEPKKKIANLSVWGDFFDTRVLDRAFQDVSVVIHSAAITRSLLKKDFYSNIEITKAIIKAAESNHIKKIIHLSSDLAQDPTGPYGASKLISEKLIENSSIKSRLNLRLSTFWGNPQIGGNSSMVKLLNNIESNRMILLPDKGQFNVSPIFFSDLISCLDELIQQQSENKWAMNLQGNSYSLIELMQEYADLRKKKLLLTNLPSQILRPTLNLLINIPFLCPPYMEFLNQLNSSDSQSLKLNYKFDPMNKIQMLNTHLNLLENM